MNSYQQIKSSLKILANPSLNSETRIEQIQKITFAVIDIERNFHGIKHDLYNNFSMMDKNLIQFCINTYKEETLKAIETLNKVKF